MLGYNAPSTPSICLVTADSLGLNNEIVWEKTLYPQADTFIIYRECMPNQYVVIGKVSRDSLSTYVDTNRTTCSFGSPPNGGDPAYTAYKYKLGYKDTCGLFSALSPYHQTVKINDNLNGSFTWNLYAVENATLSPLLYYLTRYNISSGMSTTVTATTSNSISDPMYNTLAPTGTVKWLVFASGFNCNPTQKVAAQKVKTKSNHANDKLAATSINNSYQFINNNILVYPNPAKDKLTIALNTSIQNLTIELNNILGQTLSKITNTERINIININDFASGIYLLNIKLNNKVVSVKKVIIE